MDERLITVTGYGTIHVVPDITRIELSPSACTTPTMRPTHKPKPMLTDCKTS